MTLVHHYDTIFETDQKLAETCTQRKLLMALGTEVYNISLTVIEQVLKIVLKECQKVDQSHPLIWYIYYDRNSDLQKVQSLYLNDGAR